MIKEEIKYVKNEYTDNNTINYRLVIEPKGVGNFEYTFGEEHKFDDNKIGLIRVIYKSPLPYSPKFKHIIIGEYKLNYYPIISAYGGYLGIDDFPFKAEFKKGDKLELSTDCEIQRVELYFIKQINMINNNRLANYEPPKPPTAKL